jgi:hypothetical protein
MREALLDQRGPQVLLAPDLVTAGQASKSAEPWVRHRNRDWLAGVPAWLRAVWGTKEPRPAFAGLGLNKSYLVPPAGFEAACKSRIFPGRGSTGGSTRSQTWRACPITEGRYRATGLSRSNCP